LIWDGNDELAADGQDPKVVMQQTKALKAESRQRAFDLVDNFLEKIAQVKPKKSL
jgi:hypothetical protein